MPANAAYVEPFPGYDAAVSPLRAQLEQQQSSGGMPTAASFGSGIQDMLFQTLMMPSPTQEEQKKKGPPRFLMAIPGFARGYAQAKQLEVQEQELKLRKQELAGRQAQQQLQRIALAQKIAQQQRLKRFAGIYGGLMRNEDILDLQSKRDLEGTLVEELAQAGDLEAVNKFIEARQAARDRDLIRQLEEEESAGAPSRHATAAGHPIEIDPSVQTPQPADVPLSPQDPHRTSGRLAFPDTAAQETFGREQLALAGLRQEERRLEGNIRAGTLQGGPRFKQAVANWQAQLARVQRKIERIEQRMSQAARRAERQERYAIQDRRYEERQSRLTRRDQERQAAPAQGTDIEKLNMARLAFLAQQPGPVGEQAKAALDALRRLKAQGSEGGRRRRGRDTHADSRTHAHPASPPDAPFQDPTFSGSRLEGQGQFPAPPEPERLPRVLRFRRKE
jgi:hypothetical protein